jgi:hypothetical protein
MATGSDGRAVALIQSGARVVVRHAGRRRTFGPAHPVALGDHALAPAVAVADGFAALAWTHADPSHVGDPGTRGDPCCRRLRTAVVDRAGRITAVRTLSASRAADTQAALITARGARAAVTWTDARGLRVSTATSSAGFRRAVTITARVGQVIGVALPRATPHVFMTTTGRLLETWRSGGRSHLRALGRFPAGGDFRAAVAPAGQLLAAFNRFTRARVRRLTIVARPPGRRATQRHLALRGLPEADLAVALAPSGDGLVVTSERPHRLVVRMVGRTGHARGERPLDAGATTIETAVAVDDSGGGVSPRSSSEARAATATTASSPGRCGPAAGSGRVARSPGRVLTPPARWASPSTAA